MSEFERLNRINEARRRAGKPPLSQQQYRQAANSAPMDSNDWLMWWIAFQLVSQPSHTSDSATAHRDWSPSSSVSSTDNFTSPSSQDSTSYGSASDSSASYDSGGSFDGGSSF